jgi:hypothetical protein
MKAQFYTFLFITFFIGAGGILPSSAQDTLRCNARFSATKSGVRNQATGCFDTRQAGINVTLTQPAMIHIQVFSSTGKPVSATAVPGLQGVNHLQVPIGKLEAGIYYIQVQYGNENKMSKIQKL